MRQRHILIAKMCLRRFEERYDALIFLLFLLLLFLLLLSAQKWHAGQQEENFRGLRRRDSPTCSSVSLVSRCAARVLNILRVLNESPTPLQRNITNVRMDVCRLSSNCLFNKNGERRNPDKATLIRILRC